MSRPRKRECCGIPFSSRTEVVMKFLLPRTMIVLVHSLWLLAVASVFYAAWIIQKQDYAFACLAPVIADGHYAVTDWLAV